MALPRFAVTQCGWMDEECQCYRKLWFRHYYLWLFLEDALSHITYFTGARGAPKWHQEYDYSYHRAQNSYQLFRKPLSSTISICHPFQPSPIPLLRVVLFRSVLLLTLQNFKKILDVSSIGSFAFPMLLDRSILISLPPLLRWGLNFALNGIERVVRLREGLFFIF